MTQIPTMRDMTRADAQDVLETIRAGRLYTETEAAFRDPLRRGDLIFEYNLTPPGQPERRRELLESILGSVGARTILLPPVHAGFGSNVHIGDDFFGNVNICFVDGVMIAPGVTTAR